MVHIVRKKIGNYEYLYLQKSLHIKGTYKKKTQHYAYLGRANKYTPQQIEQILSTANKKTKSQLNKLLKQYNKGHKKGVIYNQNES